MEPVKKLFRCSYSVLYEGCEQVAINLEEEMVEMNAFKKKYNAAWLADYRAKIEAARLVEDDRQRSVRHRLLRVELKQLTKGEITRAFGDLRLYMKEAYSNADERRIHMKAAGFNNLREALNFNWRLLRRVMQMASTFIAANSDALTAGDNMPEDFGELFEGLREALDAKVPVFLNELENTSQGTERKLMVSNEVFKIANGICGDGQHVFRKNPAKQRQFVWDAILRLMRRETGDIRH